MGLGVRLTSFLNIKGLMQEFSETLDLTDKSERQVSMASNIQCYSQRKYKGLALVYC